MDRHLDTTRTGPMWLRRPEIADLIVDALLRGPSLGLYDLGEFAVMGNHVHVLLLPKVDASRVLQWLKGSTAREANRILGQTGKPFWQRESYDHWVRDTAELERIAACIRENPVKAGLAGEASQYPWSSARHEYGELKFAAAR
jgi:hypothetical protein